MAVYSGKDEKDDLGEGKILGVCPLDGMKWYIGITLNSVPGSARRLIAVGKPGVLVYPYTT